MLQNKAANVKKSQQGIHARTKRKIASDRYILYKNKLKKYMVDKKQEEQGWEGVKHK